MTVTFDEATRALLDGKNFAVVATLNPDGGPQTSVVWIARDGDTVVFSTTAGRRKARNLGRDPRISLTVFDTANPYRSVEIRGSADLIEDPDRSLPVVLSRKYLGDDPPPEPPEVHRLIVRVIPQKVVTFTASQSPEEHSMSAYPVLSTQVIGQAESALGAISDPLLARFGASFNQWLVLTVTAAAGAVIDRDQLIARICGARKIGAREVEAAISDVAAAGLVLDQPRVGLTEPGQVRYREIRAAFDEVTARLFDFPPEDLATAGRVLSIITERANAELAGLDLS
jgi:PPOX class probable F420-dependent enzyme